MCCWQMATTAFSMFIDPQPPTAHIYPARVYVYRGVCHHCHPWPPAQACVEIWYTDPNTTMDIVRFENNICANVGDGGWSAPQRPDPAGRDVCSYSNTAKTSNVSVRNNVFFHTVGFEAMLYMSDPWETWAASGLYLSNNVMFASDNLPASPQPGTGNEVSLSPPSPYANARTTPMLPTPLQPPSPCLTPAVGRVHVARYAGVCPNVDPNPVRAGM